MKTLEDHRNEGTFRIYVIWLILIGLIVSGILSLLFVKALPAILPTILGLSSATSLQVAVYVNTWSVVGFLVGGIFPAFIPFSWKAIVYGPWIFMTVLIAKFLVPIAVRRLRAKS